MQYRRFRDRSRGRFSIGAVLALSLLLAACGNDDTASQPPDIVDVVAESL